MMCVSILKVGLSIAPIFLTDPEGRIMASPTYTVHSTTFPTLFESWVSTKSSENNHVGKVVEWTAYVGDAIILPSGSVRNIGAILNPTLNMETHIISMKRACYLQL